MKRSGLILLMLCFVAGWVLIWSCGSIDQSTSTAQTSVSGFDPASPDREMTADVSNSAAVMAMVLNSYDYLSAASSGAVLPFARDNAPAAGRPASLTATLLELIGRSLPARYAYQASATGSEDSECTGGGRMRITMDWEGPEQTDDSCEVQNVTGTMDLTHCSEDGQEMNGAIAFSLDGPLCAPTAMEFSLSDFSMADPNGQVQSRYLNLLATLITWDGEFPVASPTRMNIRANGQLVADLDGRELAVAFNNFIQIDNGVSLNFSGGITGPCVDGWAGLATLSAVQSVPRGCPLSGRMAINGRDGAIIDVDFEGSDAVTIGPQSIPCGQLLALDCPVP